MPAGTNLWTDAPEILRLFPTFVWKRRLRPEVQRPIDAALRRVLEPLLATGKAPEPGRGWQSETDLHRRETLAGFVSVIDAAVADVLGFLRIGPHGAVITGCWANVNGPGIAHPMHAHPNNYLSGVYYVEVPPGGNTINFHDPRGQAAVIRPPVTALTAYNTDQVVVEVSGGTLLVFPAWLPHSVAVNRSAGARISVSFNAMFAAFAESLARPLWEEE